MAGSKKGLDMPKGEAQKRAKKAADMLSKEPVIGKTAVGNQRKVSTRTARALRDMGL